MVLTPLKVNMTLFSLISLWMVVANFQTSNAFMNPLVSWPTTTASGRHAASTTKRFVSNWQSEEQHQNHGNNDEDEEEPEDLDGLEDFALEQSRISDMLEGKGPDSNLCWKWTQERRIELLSCFPSRDPS